MAVEDSGERFIDADDPVGYGDKNNYENILINQISKCVLVLSKEPIGGFMKQTKEGSIYVEDVKEETINTVDTFRMILKPFIKNKSSKGIDDILKDIKDEQKKMGEKSIMVPGRGSIKIKDISNMSVQSPIWKEWLDFKYKKYRELFELLISAYHQAKMDIAASEIDY